MKIVTVEAEFPELTAGRMYQNTKVEATSVPAALRMALKEILGREGIKRKRLSVIKLRLSISNSNGRNHEGNSEPSVE